MTRDIALQRLREDRDAAEMHLRSCTAYATAGDVMRAYSEASHALVHVAAMKEVLKWDSEQTTQG